jgi:glycosyltransferase 2 family protein
MTSAKVAWRRFLPQILWLVALLMVGAILSQLPLADLRRNLAQLSIGQWLFWLSLNTAIILLFNARWWLLGRALQLPLSFSRLLFIRQAGQCISFITPGPQFGGEPLQLLWLWQRGKIPLVQSLLVLGVDRFYEFWINFSVLLICVLLLLASPATQLAAWSHLALALMLVLVVMLVLIKLALQRPVRIFIWLERVARRWQQDQRLANIDTQWQQLSASLKELLAHQKSSLLNALSLSLLAWLGLLGELYVLLVFFKLDVSVTQFLVILVAMRLSFLLPLPGAIGTLEAALLWAFHSLGLPIDAAVGVLALMRLRDALVLLWGLWCLRRLQVADGKLGEAKAAD